VKPDANHIQLQKKKSNDTIKRKRSCSELVIPEETTAKQARENTEKIEKTEEV